MAEAGNPQFDFIEASCVPLRSSHGSGTLERANAILAAHPGIAGSSIQAASILGDDDAVRRFVQRDAESATAKGGPHDWDALTYLCFSRYLRLDRARTDGFVRTATTLLDAGASANTGWFEQNHQPDPVWESALYGAAGVAHHPEVTRVLLERGANPNDEETPYHVAEGYDNAAMQVVVESGRLNIDSLTTLLFRKADWHDHDGMSWLLARGADPNRLTRWGRSALYHSVQRDNRLDIIAVMLDHGGDPAMLAVPSDDSQAGASGISAGALAARRGRGDILDLLEGRGLAVELEGVDRLLAACARDDSAAVRSIAALDPDIVRRLVADGGKALAEFSGVGNTPGVGHLLDLGVDVRAPYRAGDGYYGISINSMAIHVAAWRARHTSLLLLIERGSPIDEPDGDGRTPLALAVRACVNSYWSDRRSDRGVRALLDAGASAHHPSVMFPSGYPEVDALLQAHRA